MEHDMNITLPENYRPSDDEEFMSSTQREYFKQKLLSWREQLLKESSETINNLQVEAISEPDIIDSAANEADRAIELRARDRERKLINKIEEALRRIEDGSYGYCEETGDPIGVRRLDARPIATLSIDAQERHERRERLQRDF